MKTFAGFSALAALAVLAGCATNDRVTPAPAPVVVNPPASTVVVPPQAQASVPPGGAIVVAPAPAPLVAGTGRIDSIVPVPASAAAGASAANSANKRVGIRMDNGAVQYLDTNAAGLSLGDRVEITSDGYMRRPAP
jgi:hypothetical protein